MRTNLTTWLDEYLLKECVSAKEKLADCYKKCAVKTVSNTYPRRNSFQIARQTTLSRPTTCGHSFHTAPNALQQRSEDF